MRAAGQRLFVSMYHQCGAVSAITVLLLAIVVMLVLVMSIRISTTGVNDTLNQSDSVAALFLAESGLENATQRLDSGAALCDATLVATANLGRGGFNVQAGLTTDYDGVTPLPASQCRVRVSATISNSNVTRVIQAIVNIGGGGGGGIVLDNNDSRVRTNQSTASMNFTTSGNDRLLMVGISLRRNNNQVVTGVTYAGIPLTRQVFVNNDPDIRVEIYSLVAPALGSNNLSVTIDNTTRFVVGVASFTGVDQTTPLELPGSFNTGSFSQPSVTVTTTTNNAVVFDTQGELIFDPNVGAGQTELWSERTGGNPFSRVRGSGSYEGPVSPAGNVIMSWSWNLTRWAIGAVAIRPSANVSSLLSWREVIQ